MKLKEVIELTKKGIIRPCVTVMLSENIKIKKSLANIQDENWSKIKHIAPAWRWKNGEKVDGMLLKDQISSSNKLFGSDSKFVNKDILKEFKKYVSTSRTLAVKGKGDVGVSKITEHDVIDTSYYDIMGMFTDDQKIFGRNGDIYSSYRSKEALLFMKSIINNNYQQIIEYQKGVGYQLEEWKKDDIVNIQQGKDQTLSDIEKLLYNPINEIPFIGTLYSVPRAIFYAAEGEISEAVKSAVNVFGGTIRDAGTLEGLGAVASLAYSVGDSFVDNSIQELIKWTKNQDQEEISWIHNSCKDKQKEKKTFVLLVDKNKMEGKKILDKLNHVMNLRAQYQAQIQVQSK